LKELITLKADEYGWQLFPLNQPKVNQFLYDPKHAIREPGACSLAKRVKSLDFQGKSVGKCIFRDSADCSTCACNLTALTRSVRQVDWATIKGLITSFYG
jgi:hypothetical protein